MKSLGLAVFLSVFFSIYALVNFYIFIRGLEALPHNSLERTVYILLFWGVALSFIVGRVFERFLPVLVCDPLIWIGSFWIAAMLYLFMAVLLLDFLRGTNALIGFLPASLNNPSLRIKEVTALVTLGVVGVILIAGHINALFRKITRLPLTIHKKAGEMKSLNIVAASDIHLGTIVGRRRFDRMVEAMNRLNPDLVLLPGDIVDEDLGPVIRQNIGESLKNLKAKYGVYAITGNHEYFGGVEEACRYLTEHHVTVLRDATVKINGGVYLVGREDRSYNHRSGQKRKSLEALMAGIDRNSPVIVMDHQPFGLQEVATQGADLQLSGHTHHGQLWPMNYIIRAIYEVGWGFRKIGETHVYVSNGVGTWGPPVRVGNRPEIVNIQLSFE